MYNLFPFVFNTLTHPIMDEMRIVARHLPPDQRTYASTFVFHGFTEPFFMRVQLSAIGGIIIAVPFITLEFWGFVVPALTLKERRPFQAIAPFAVLLFIVGVSLAYYIMPFAVKWFLSYLTDFQGAILLQDPQDYIVFVVKMLVVFGLVFQLPIIMMALGRFGIIRSAMLSKYWRHCVVALTVIAMVVTPSNDPFSMCVMAVPLVGLFLISIGLVRLVEPKPS
jgi:sec-independent protein translocase protein TatC